VLDRSLDEQPQYEDCGTGDTAISGNTLICYGATIDNCLQTVEQMYNANPGCTLPGYEKRDGACYSCPGKTIEYEEFVAGSKPPRTQKKTVTIGTSWIGNGRCKGSFAGKDYYIDALKTSLQCSPPPPVYGSNNLKLAVETPQNPNPFLRDGKCYANYCTKKKMPSKVLSCSTPPGRTAIQFPGAIVQSGNKGTCKVSEGIVTSYVATYGSPTYCPSGYTLNTSTNKCVMAGASDIDPQCHYASAMNLSGKKLYCQYCDTGALNYTPDCNCCRSVDSIKISATECRAKFGTAKDGFYRPYTLTAEDILAPFIVPLR
jgi:hypothetical protein